MLPMDEKIRHAVQEIDLEPPALLRHSVLNAVKTTSIRRKKKRPLLISAMIAALLLPSSALAYNHTLADDLYGSFEQIKKRVTYFTMDSYFLVNVKLSAAKGELGDSEYEDFKGMLQKITTAKMKYGDKYGNIDYDLLPHHKVQELKGVYMDIQPFFDSLNHEQSSKSLLSQADYEQYIDALMLHEKILVKNKINPSDRYKIADINAVDQVAFEYAEHIIDTVNERISH
ncbi:DUF3600 domain-containing protein [Bacillus sp. 1P06AnD]|uniref:DUF3600 domain-containing protein n=1 Tax=Bacillus sp. 1P06AnD TaxID=3132208 RepID=UPI0039A280BE